MKIDFINHAAFVIDTGKVRLLCDPWLFGRIFNSSWSLMCQSPEIDWQSLSHIWISHEHPDHFHPPSLMSCPESQRRGITILYQRTSDGRVASWLRDKGFVVHELRGDTPLQVANSLTIKVGPMPTGDSWLYATDGAFSILNFNDCLAKTDSDALAIAHRTGPVDVLATQFTYAGWVGDEPQERKLAARECLEMTYRLDAALRPKWLLPFASFSWFSHPENVFNNDCTNRIDKVREEVQNRISSDVIVMYPGDSWMIGDGYSNDISVEKYAEAYERTNREIAAIKSLPDTELAVDMEVLVDKAAAYARRFRRKNWLLWPFNVNPANIWLFDREELVRFHPNSGLTHAAGGIDACDIGMSSDSMAVWFDNDWGGATVYISARIRVPDMKKYRSNVYPYFYISNANNRGEIWPHFDIRRRLRAEWRSFVFRRR